MVSVLPDTGVLSETQRLQGAPRVRARVELLDPERVVLSAITVGELVKGIALLEPGARQQRLAVWLLGLERRSGDRILRVDTEVARLWGEATARAQRNGVILPATDGLIAATALRHGLHVMTRNTRHFAAAGVPLVNPWEAS